MRNVSLAFESKGDMEMYIDSLDIDSSENFKIVTRKRYWHLSIEIVDFENQIVYFLKTNGMV